MRKIELEIVALSNSTEATHYYAVILGEINGLRRLPIVIGAFEAQAIVVALEKVRPSRPLTHDLFQNFMQSFDIDLEEVLIHKLEEGVFFAKLFCRQGDRALEIDSRTSDALALAIRSGCPIFIYEDILKTAGLLMDSPIGGSISASSSMEAKQQTESSQKGDDLKRFSVEELHDMLAKVLEQEEYMKAVAIRDELERRKKK